MLRNVNTKSGTRFLFYLSLALFLMGTLINQWTVETFFSADGDLSESTRLKIYTLQFLCFFLSAFLYIFRHSITVINITQRFLLVVFPICFTIAIAEFVLSVYSGNVYYVWPPNLEVVFEPFPNVMPGINGLQRFTTDSSGIRSISNYDDADYRILAIGGSTTECLYLDDNGTWSAILEKNLNKRSTIKYWVGNVGRSGLNTRHHIFEVKYLLPQFPEIDAVLLLVGINDLLTFLGTNRYYSINQILGSNKFLRETFSNHLVKMTHIADIIDYRNYHSFFLVNNASYILTNKKNFQDEAGYSYIRHRNERLNSNKKRQLPSLENGMREYSENLNYIVDICRENNVTIIIATQPTLWSENMLKELNNLLWMGRTSDDSTFYEPSSLDNAMTQYNNIVRNVSIARDLQLVDLDNYLPKDTTAFYDDCHFNEDGAVLVGEYFFSRVTAILTE